MNYKESLQTLKEEFFRESKRLGYSEKEIEEKWLDMAVGNNHSSKKSLDQMEEENYQEYMDDKRKDSAKKEMDERADKIWTDIISEDLNDEDEECEDEYEDEDYEDEEEYDEEDEYEDEMDDAEEEDIDIPEIAVEAFSRSLLSAYQDLFKKDPSSSKKRSILLAKECYIERLKNKVGKSFEVMTLMDFSNLLGAGTDTDGEAYQYFKTMMLSSQGFVDSLYLNYNIAVFEINMDGYLFRLSQLLNEYRPEFCTFGE